MNHFLPFYPINNPKNQNFEKMKQKPWRYYLLYTRTKNHDHMLYCSWDMVHDRCNCFHFGLFFCPFTPQQPEKSKFWKNEKNPGYIIILYMCTLNDNHMMYGFWDMKHGVWQTEFFVILNHFLPFYLPKNLKNQNFEKLKKLLELLSFYTSAPKIMIICYTVPEIWQMTDVIVIFHFGLFFALLAP